MGEIRRSKVALDSLGCKLNQAETELLARQLAEAGHELVSAVGEADVYILNTCTVTHIADRKSRHLLRQAHRENPSARLVVVGCYAERSPQELARLEGVDLVLGNEQKQALVRLLEERGCLPPQPLAQACPYRGSRTRAFIKVQDGCQRFCAYCVVPLVRRREESLPPERVIAEIRHWISLGAREVVLTGTEIGAYNWQGAGLKELLERILAETDVARLRLSSLQPQEITPELVGLWRDERLCPHFHLSLQSGSDTVLARMKRRYTTARYQQAVSMIRQVAPEAAITTDVIVGFPGETEAEFEESLGFCRRMEFARIHVFPYSPRPGTEAARMPQQVGDKVKKERRQRMLALAEESARNFHQRFLGRTMAVLWEKQMGGVWSGLTANYIKVYTKSAEDLTNRLMPVKLEKLSGDGVWGEARCSISSPVS
ncbi:MAG TPA: tRNA (N(6)-L-threonylcarbamoyladenosine(37)-C(2))-methylthiotransferase MtaB [Dehalococcoidia bacterium]|jgi:threonylcarbamoyladenosine tRNA methylthiotransferase MtaB|nr:tRNA (N(6)-L-threonylcarbamoyladenosine(37)-C(2))-methylthiotransferase MtaB [Dehalococcoidia bacterium]